MNLFLDLKDKIIMIYLKKFNEEVGNPHHPHSFNRIEDFITRADKIINYDENEYEQGDEPSNVDILSELGDLCNELKFTSEEIQHVIDTNRVSDIDNFLQIILEDTLENEGKKVPSKSGWYWILIKGFTEPTPCWYMGPDRFNNYEIGDENFLPGGMGDSSSNGIYMDDVEKIGPEIIVPNF